MAWLACGAAVQASSAAPQPIVLAATPGTASFAAADNLPFATQLTSLEERLFAGVKDGRFQRFSLIEAALIASGVDDNDTLQSGWSNLAAWAKELRLSKAADGTARQQAQTIFEFLHRRVLTGGYSLECTDLRQALEHGRFNCVSASVLFNCLAGELGLKVCGLEMPGHAMSRLLGPDGPLDIETTCPRWFQLLDHPQKQAEMVEKTLGRLPGKAREARQVSDVQLVAMIYYNRGVDLLSEKRFDEAAAANAKALRLDPSNGIARGNYLATINNWAIELGSVRRYDEAASLLRLGLAVDPDYQAFALNLVHVYRQWADHLCAAGQFDQAMRLLDQAAGEKPEDGTLRQAQAEVYHRWARAVKGRAGDGSAE